MCAVECHPGLRAGVSCNCMPPVRLRPPSPEAAAARIIIIFFLISKLPRRLPLIGPRQRMRVDARALAGRRSGHVLARRGVSRRKFRALRRGGVFLRLINRARALSGRSGHGSDASSRRARRLLGNAGFAVLRREIGCARWRARLDCPSPFRARRGEAQRAPPQREHYCCACARDGLCNVVAHQYLAARRRDRAGARGGLSPSLPPALITGDATLPSARPVRSAVQQHADGGRCYDDGRRSDSALVCQTAR